MASPIAPMPASANRPRPRSKSAITSTVLTRWPTPGDTRPATCHRRRAISRHSRTPRRDVRMTPAVTWLELPPDLREEQYREWAAELPAILHDPQARFGP